MSYIYSIEKNIPPTITKLNSFCMDNLKCGKTIEDKIPALTTFKLFSLKENANYFLYANPYSAKKWSRIIYNYFTIYQNNQKTYAITILNNKEWAFLLNEDIDEDFIKVKIEEIKKKVKLYCKEYKINGLFFIEFSVNVIKYRNNDIEVEVHPHIHGLTRQGQTCRNAKEFKEQFSGGLGNMKPVQLSKAENPKEWIDYCCNGFPYHGYKRMISKEGKWFNMYSEYIDLDNFTILMKALSKITFSRLTFAVGDKQVQLLKEVKEKTLKTRKEGQQFLKHTYLPAIQN